MPRPSRPWKTAARLDRVAAGRPFGPAGSPAGRPARPGPAPGFHGTRRCSSLPLRDPHSRSFCYPGAYTRSGQGRHRRNPAARDWNCTSLRCPRRVAGSVPEARASQSLAHRPLPPIRNGPVAFSDEGLSLITAWLQVLPRNSNFPRLRGTPWIFRGSEQALPVHGLCEEGSPPGGGLGPFVSGVRKSVSRCAARALASLSGAGES